jgi:hypothetical protein
MCPPPGVTGTRGAIKTRALIFPRGRVRSVTFSGLSANPSSQLIERSPDALHDGFRDLAQPRSEEVLIEDSKLKYQGDRGTAKAVFLIGIDQEGAGEAKRF